MINLGQAVDYFSKPLTLKSKGVDSYDSGGNLVSPEPTLSTISGSIQPATGRELMIMPEGIREEARHILSTTANNVKNNDVISDGVDEYRVIYIFRSTLGHYTRAALGLIE